MPLLLDFILHIDTHLQVIMENYGTFTYIILFLIVFCETGLVVMPFLPGDSLLFAAGTFAAQGSLDLWILFAVFFLAATIGDSTNYAIGARIGHHFFEKDWWFIKKAHLKKTQEFYEKKGDMAIIIARFIPIVRTFVPFVAGIGKMPYHRFMVFNVVGALLWIALFLVGGYCFGNIPHVRDNFTLVILAIILISLLPGVIEWARKKNNSP